MSTRRERLEARAERRREWAAAREARAESAHERARTIADGIPMGQPILVGHHSERRHRRDVARIENGMRAGFESAKMAQRHEEAADGIERQLRTSIFSDDVDAVEQLHARIAELEAKRDRIKAYNASARKGAPDASVLTEAERADILSIARVASYQLAKGGGFPSYVLSNLGANIRRLQERATDVQRQQADKAAGVRRGGRPMASRYAGTCPDCGEDFERGAAIVWFRSTREAVHATCAERGQA